MVQNIVKNSSFYVYTVCRLNAACYDVCWARVFATPARLLSLKRPQPKNPWDAPETCESWLGLVAKEITIISFRAAALNTIVCLCCIITLCLLSLMISQSCIELGDYNLIPEGSVTLLGQGYV